MPGPAVSVFAVTLCDSFVRRGFRKQNNFQEQEQTLLVPPPTTRMASRLGSFEDVPEEEYVAALAELTKRCDIVLLMRGKQWEMV